MIVLTESDYQPLATYAFQHWNERSGPAFSRMRPLTADAAQRVWDRARRLSASQWADADAGDRFDLQAADWDPAAVRDWLTARVPDRDQHVLICFQPTAAVRVPWGSLCDHWLILLWTGGCAWPLDESWVLIHDGEQFVFGRKDRQAEVGEDEVCPF